MLRTVLLLWIHAQVKTLGTSSPAKQNKEAATQSKFWSLFITSLFKHWQNTFQRGIRPGCVSLNCHTEWLLYIYFFFNKKLICQKQKLSQTSCTLQATNTVWHRMLSKVVFFSHQYHPQSSCLASVLSGYFSPAPTHTDTHRPPTPPAPNLLPPLSLNNTVSMKNVRKINKERKVHTTPAYIYTPSHPANSFIAGRAVPGGRLKELPDKAPSPETRARRVPPNRLIWSVRTWRLSSLPARIRTQ